MLKLVYKAEPTVPPPAEIIKEPVEPLPMTPFTSKTIYKGPNLYSMEIHDHSHYLNCELVLELEENPDKDAPLAVICHLPEISDEMLNAFIWEDDTLYAITMIQFQMRILKELLTFCTNHYAEKLVMYLEEDLVDEFGIYQDFLVYEDQIQNQEEGLTKMIIPVNSEIMEEWMDFMNQATLRFQQTLWQFQRKNPAIQHYLKSHPFCKEC
jgi:hypothetical protein